MTVASVLALALFTAPTFVVEHGLWSEIEGIAGASWMEMERLLEREGIRSPISPRSVRIGTTATLGPGTAAVSRPGLVLLRSGLSWPGNGTIALRHEIAHQLLFEVCPAASADRLFHEAFALSASGEISAWSSEESGRYLPLAKALEVLSRSADLDGPKARRALARLLGEAAPSTDRIPKSIERRLARCEAGTDWFPLRPEDLAEDQAQAADALVILSRHSGQILPRKEPLRFRFHLVPL